MADPPFGSRTRAPNWIQIVSRSWEPLPPYTFIGGRQPFAPRKLNPIFLEVDSPPAYLWKLLTLPPEDPTFYARVQRYANNKIIVSVDNPPPDDERLAVLQVISSIWNAPAYPVQTLQKKVAATANQGSTASAVLSSAGVATGNLTGASLASSPIQAAGAATSSFVGQASQNTAPKKPFQPHVLRAWEAPAPVQQPRRFAPQAIATAAAGDLRSTGVATMTFIGTSLASSPITAAGVATAAFRTASAAAARLTSAGQATATLVGSTLVGGSAVMNAAGTSTATLTSAQTAQARMTSAGSATMRMVGKAVGGTRRNLDGWLPAARRAQLALERKRKDEEELMLMAAALMPLLHASRELRAS